MKHAFLLAMLTTISCYCFSQTIPHDTRTISKCGYQSEFSAFNSMVLETFVNPDEEITTAQTYYSNDTGVWCYKVVITCTGASLAALKKDFEPAISLLRQKVVIYNVIV